MPSLNVCHFVEASVCSLDSVVLFIAESWIWGFWKPDLGYLLLVTVFIWKMPTDVRFLFHPETSSFWSLPWLFTLSRYVCPIELRWLGVLKLSAFDHQFYIWITYYSCMMIYYCCYRTLFYLPCSISNILWLLYHSFFQIPCFPLPDTCNIWNILLRQLYTPLLIHWSYHSLKLSHQHFVLYIVLCGSTPSTCFSTVCLNALINAKTWLTCVGSAMLALSAMRGEGAWCVVAPLLELGNPRSGLEIIAGAITLAWFRPFQIRAWSCRIYSTDSFCWACETG